MTKIGSFGTEIGKKAMLLGSGELGKEVAIELVRLGVEVVACDRYEGAPAMQIAQKSKTFNQFDVSAALTTYLLFSNLNTASVADDTLITDTLVLTAGALIVACWTEDALAEQAVALGLVSTVVDGLRLCHLAIRIFQDFLRRGKSDGNLREIILNFCIFLESHIFL